MSEPIPPAPQDPHAQNPYGQEPYGQNPSGQSPYGQNPSGPPQAPQYQQPQYPQQPPFPPYGAAQGPAGLGYPAPPVNTFGLDRRVFGIRLTNTDGVQQEVKISYYLWLAASALNVLAGLINLFVLPGRYGAFVFVAALIGLAFGVVFSALWLFCAIRAKEGAKWGRIVLTVLGVLSVFSFLGQLGGPSLSMIPSLLAVVGTVFLWLPKSRTWFRQMSGRG
ncbi:hypothetical protein GCM10027449_18960 [Sinomonas notoginsengisoli]|uniref:secretory carrier-associated membrane protein n=1 Tax=Sinomonas notoginsengisoli TaxID=1457311 RepID=UPI001F2095FE|nr:secretory carrier-associated membrane protein [Sinomonas notoginsengisoli]